MLARALVSAVVLACIDFRLNILAGTASVVVVTSSYFFVLPVCSEALKAQSRHHT